MQRTTRRVPPNWRECLPPADEYFEAVLAPLSPRNEKGLRVGPCPFEDGTDMTLQVDVGGARGLWRCHACGKHGDIVTFVMQLRGVQFNQAVWALLHFAQTRTAPGSQAISKRLDGRRQ